jgi:hypothetical protein
MEKWSCICKLAMYVCSHSIPMGRGNGIFLPSDLHSLKIIIEILDI